MSKPTKDDINFRGFLKAMKKMQRVSNETVAKGLCATSSMSRISRGVVLPKKLTRDRIVARLGVSGEGYEDYLQMDEYDDWSLRQKIIGCVEEKKIEELQKLLAEYSGRKLDKVEKQFLETMRFMMLRMNNAPEKELCSAIETAVSYTIPVIDNGFPKKLLLADQEINLLIEYVNLHRSCELEAENLKWKMDRYEDIFRYIEQSCIDNIGKAKVYPKLVYYVCQEYRDDRGSIEDVRECLELCNNAVELLRNTRRLYYFVELMEVRQWLIGRILNSKIMSDEAIVAELEKVAETSKAWAEVMVSLYTEYHVPPYMEDFCYLYLETESHCINDIVRIRRKMLKLTQKQVAGEDCDEKTVRRTENRKMNPQMYAVRGMFKNLGLCPEYVRARVISTDPKALELRREVAKYNNEKNATKWEAALNELETKVCMDIVQNEQAIRRNRVLLEECKNDSPKEETIPQLLEVLEMTMPFESILRSKEWYLTIEEINCLHNMAVRIKPQKKNEYFDLLIKYCREQIEGHHVLKRMGIHDLLITGIASYLGNLKEYDESSKYSAEMIKISLTNRRMPFLARNLYNNYWNTCIVNGTEPLARDSQEVDNTLSKCILLSEIVSDETLKKIFTDKKHN